MKCSVFACVSLYFIHNTYWFIELVSAAHAYILNDPLILIEKKKSVVLCIYGVTTALH